MKDLTGFLKAYAKTVSKEEEAPKRSHCVPIAVSRQLGSGGKLVAQRIAERLGFQLFDKEILQQIAMRAKVAPNLAELMDEKPGRFLELLGASLLRGAELHPEEFDRYLHITVESLLELGNVVLVGRGAIFVAKPGHALRLRIVAPEPMRVKNAMAYFDCSEKQARSRMLAIEKERSAFQKRMFHKSETLPEHVDLTVNMECMSVDDAAELAIQAVRHICHRRSSHQTTA